MQRYAATVITLLLAALSATAQQQPPATNQAPAAMAAGGQEIYHVTVSRAAPGKLNDLISAYRSMNDPSAQNMMLFRHRQGDSWDLVAITPQGPRAVVEPTAPPAVQAFTAQFQMARAWHGDSFFAGPPLAEFQRSLTPARANQMPQALYIVSMYQALPGRRADLGKLLQRLSSAGAIPNSAVALSHVEGAPWDFILLQRYDTWQQFVDDEQRGEELAKKAGFASAQAQSDELRSLMSMHADTLTTRIK